MSEERKQMTTADCNALADAIREQIARELTYPGAVQRPFTFGQLHVIVDVLKVRNPELSKDAWFARISNGTMGE